MASLDELTQNTRATDDGFDTGLGRQIAEDIACNREGRLSTRQRDIIREHVSTAQQSQDVVKRLVEPWSAIVSVIVGFLCFLLTSAWSLPTLLGLMLATAIGTLSFPIFVQILRQYIRIDPELGIPDPGKQPAWIGALAPGLSRVEGNIRVLGLNRVKVGGIEYTTQSEIVDWIQQNNLLYGAAYSLVGFEERNAISIEPLFSAHVAQFVLDELRRKLDQRQEWTSADPADLEARLRTISTITPFLITAQENTIDVFRANMKGMISPQQVKRVWQAQTRYPSDSTRELWVAPPPTSPQVRDDIQYIEGNARFGYRYDGGRKYPTISIEGQHFRASQAVWEEMKAYGGRIGIHYLKPMSVPILLSIQPLPLRDLPTEKDLERVVGIGSDGELIYKEDVTANLSDESKPLISLD